MNHSKQHYGDLYKQANMPRPLRAAQRGPEFSLNEQGAPSRLRFICLACIFLIAALDSAFGQFQYAELMSFGDLPGLYGVRPDWLIQSKDGALYGTTFYGGTNLDGVIFKVNKDGTGFLVLHHTRKVGGGTPGDSTSIIEGSDGVLYGSTWGDPNVGYNRGTLFRLNRDGTDFRILHLFEGLPTDPGNPSRLVEGQDGALYGMANQGALFRLNKDGSGYQILHSFKYAGAGQPISRPRRCPLRELRRRGMG
jgi:uncharacterized repeat protein (TIGR03803 family)